MTPEIVPDTTYGPAPCRSVLQSRRSRPVGRLLSGAYIPMGVATRRVRGTERLPHLRRHALADTRKSKAKRHGHTATRSMIRALAPWPHHSARTNDAALQGLLLARVTVPGGRPSGGFRADRRPTPPSYDCTAFHRWLGKPPRGLREGSTGHGTDAPEHCGTSCSALAIKA